MDSLALGDTGAQPCALTSPRPAQLRWPLFSRTTARDSSSARYQSGSWISGRGRPTWPGQALKLPQSVRTSRPGCWRPGAPSFLRAEPDRRSEAGIARRGLREREEVWVPLEEHDVLCLFKARRSSRYPLRHVTLAGKFARRELPLLFLPHGRSWLQVATVVRFAGDVSHAALE